MYRIRSLDRTPLRMTVPSVGRLAVSPRSKDLEENSCRILSKFFVTQKTSLNPDIVQNEAERNFAQWAALRTS